MDQDGASSSAGTATPADRTPGGQPPGIRAQFGATFEAVKRLLRAHIELGKAEIGEIAGEAGKLIGLGIGAIVLSLFAGALFIVGLFLFLGEWLFGSLGWGVLLGTLLLVDLAIVTLLVAVGVSGRRIGTSFLLGALIGVGIGLLFGFDVLHQGWRALGDAVATSVIPDEATRTVVTAVVVLGTLAGILGFLFGIRSGVRTGFVGFIGAAILGALLGWITATEVSGQIGAALGVLVALLVWPMLAARDLRATGIDTDAMKAKFYPTETVNLTKETIEWVRARTPLVPKS